MRIVIFHNVLLLVSKEIASYDNICSISSVTPNYKAIEFIQD